MLTTREYVTTHVNIEGPLLQGPLLVIVHFRLPIPESFKGPKRQRFHLLPHAKRPDGDNLEKFLNDALTGVLWQDDAQIAWLLRSKSLTASKIGSTTIFAKEIPAGRVDYVDVLSSISEHLNQEEGNEKTN
jgi:Holliday junction resolvase RusA-like endonuclease